MKILQPRACTKTGVTWMKAKSSSPPKGAFRTQSLTSGRWCIRRTVMWSLWPQRRWNEDGWVVVPGDDADFIYKLKWMKKESVIMTTATFPPRLEAVELIGVILFRINTQAAQTFRYLCLDKTSYSYAFNVLEKLLFSCVKTNRVFFDGPPRFSLFLLRF